MTNYKLNETSASVQAHLGIMQSVIERMASNSTASKTWCITIVSAILVLVADRGNAELAFIAFLPTFLFLCLDSYYLALEKSFRSSYNIFVNKLHEQSLQPQDLYCVNPVGNILCYQIEALKSFSVWGFYFGLLFLVYIAHYLIEA